LGTILDNTLACAEAIKQVTDVTRVLMYLSVPKWEFTNKVRLKPKAATPLFCFKTEV
jgi:hypothetical protein